MPANHDTLIYLLRRSETIYRKLSQKRFEKFQTNDQPTKAGDTFVRHAVVGPANRISRVLPRALIRERERDREREREREKKKVARPFGPRRGKYLQDGWRAGAYCLLLDGQVRVLTVLFGTRWTDHTRAGDLRLRIDAAPLDRTGCQPRLQPQVPIKAEHTRLEITQ